MGKIRNITSLNLLLTLTLLIGLSVPGTVKPALAHPGKLIWTIVDTPGVDNTTIVRPSEINAIAIGSDGKTFYTVDIANSRVYKSTDSGVTWKQTITGRLTAAGANLPAWDIAVAPDNPNFVAAVTNATGATGPREVFVSTNGGDRWDNAGLVVADNVSAIDISMDYGGGRHDIAIGTRTGAGTGAVWVLKTPGLGSWVDQSIAPSVGWTGGDVVALRFSPTYSSDSSLVVVSANATGTFLSLGIRDVINNTTTWNGIVGYPAEVALAAGTSANCTQIITADLELPSDFSGQTASLRRYYISYDDAGASTVAGVYRIDDTTVYRITPPATGRISSLAYYGTYASGKLLAAEVTVAPTSSKVATWRSSDPEANPPCWQRSDAIKSPTGGGNSGYANAQVAWDPNGYRAYCGTSSALLINGASWPAGYTTSVALDESAFSVTLDGGEVWNQLSIIDTDISFLSDVAVLEVPEDSKDYNVLYLASVNANVTVPRNFDSVWRSTSDPLGDEPLGRTWERVLCIATSNNGTILRLNPRTSEMGERSEAIVFADRFTANVSYSPDEGQYWQVLTPNANVTDLTLASDEVIYILEGVSVCRGSQSGGTWTWQAKVDTMLGSGHTIATPLKNPESESSGGNEDWVIVGDAGLGQVAYADFSKVPLEFQPPPEERVIVPVPGNMHVIADDEFEQNKTIYAASHDLVFPPANRSGKIYRWVIGESTQWDQLQPPNNAFYGLAQRKGVLYGAWDVPTPPNTPPGVDRTFYPRARVPPPPQWDDLTAGLPAAGTVNFTREPSSLKISNNSDNTLWAIDNNPYNWTTRVGCLWAYADTLAKVGPWTTSPASGDFIPVDPVTGRATEINFRWRQLAYALVYELQLAKDDEFSLRLITAANITPPEPLSPAWILAPGVLEANHTYYWRVRARAGTTGEIVRSPWSATMFFTVKAGLPVTTEHLGPTLFKPANGARDISPSPHFFWSPILSTTKYEFILAKDAALTQIVAKATVPTTAYEYEDKLDWNTVYFWQVRAIEPIPSEPSPIANFMVIAKEASVPPPPSPPSLPIPFWIWAVTAIYAALVAAIIALATTNTVYVRQETTTANKPNPILDRPKHAIARIKNAITVKIKGASSSEE